MENDPATNHSSEVSTCCICQGNLFRNYFVGSINLIRCRQCGYVTQDPIPTIDPASVAGADVNSFLASGRQWLTPERKRNLEDIALRVSRLTPEGRVLDVGCGDGMFMHLCREAGLEASGIEPHAGLAKRAEENSGGSVASGLYKADSFPENSFDIISFIHSLEHFTNPAQALDTALLHLRPNGLVVIDLPSIRSIHWLLWRVSRIRKFVDNAYGVIPEHIGYFTPHVIRKLFHKKGLRFKNLTAGRWRYRYSGVLGLLGLLLDPLFNLFGIGGMFCIAQKRADKD